MEEVFDFWVQDVGVEAAAARDILLMYPQLLGTATEGLRRRLEALRALFKGSCWTAEQIVASVPRVLCKLAWQSTHGATAMQLALPAVPWDVTCLTTCRGVHSGQCSVAAGGLAVQQQRTV